MRMFRAKRDCQRDRRRANGQLLLLKTRVSQLEQAVALLRVNQIGPRELAGVCGRVPSAEEDTSTEHELEKRLIGLFDSAWQELQARQDAEDCDRGTWEFIYWELREALACTALAPEFPEGPFDPRAAQASAVVATAERHKHNTVAEVKRPAVVREQGNKSRIVRPAVVTVWGPASADEASIDNGGQES